MFKGTARSTSPSLYVDCIYVLILWFYLLFLCFVLRFVLFWVYVIYWYECVKLSCILLQLPFALFMIRQTVKTVKDADNECHR